MEASTANPIKPQERQWQALSSAADILFYGGGAGGGKTYALLLDAMRHVHRPGYAAVIFRRTHPMIVQEGGLWDKSNEIYPLEGARSLRGDRWIFPSGATVRFGHMQYEKDKEGFRSSQIAFIAFDEITEFSESMFFFMLSRNRSTSGVKPCVRCACNPDADSWVATFISWWIDQDTGFPIFDRAGVLRWFVRVNEKIEWGDSHAELHERFPAEVAPPGAPDNDPRMRPLSVTFIPATLQDNQELMKKDPAYRHKLLVLPLVERERLLGGNWKIRPAAGLKFPRDRWFIDHDITTVPPGMRLTRYWDKAGTEGGSGARTAGVLIGELPNHERLGLPQYWIADVVADRWGDAAREGKIVATAALDTQSYGHVAIGMEREPGSGGKHSTNFTIRKLAGYDVYSFQPTTNKAARWNPLASQQQIGNVGIIKGDWDWAEFIRELDGLSGDEKLDKKLLKDCADAAAGGFQYLTGNVFNSQTVLLDSTDPETKAPLTEAELKQMPDFWQELIKDQRELNREFDNDDDWK